VTGGLTGAGAVARIAYASRARVAGAVYAEMERIRAAAVRNNVPLGVHTALLHQSGWFLQWKEGPGEALLRLMHRVQADPRHAEMRIVHSSRGPRLLDGPWSMAIVRSDESPEAMEARVRALQRSMWDGTQYNPVTVWRRLSTPLQHVAADRQGDPDAFQRVLVCSAAGTLAYRLVEWLGKRHRVAVLRRRFAGATALDVETDYVDFDAGTHAMRVIAMARRGLEMPLTRAFMPDYSHVLLLLSGETGRDRALLLRLAKACAGRSRTPTLVGVAPEAGVHAAMRTSADGLGLAYAAVQGDPESPLDSWEAVQPELAAWQPAQDSLSPVLQINWGQIPISAATTRSAAAPH
jgi:hypothetical protein